MSEEIEYDGKHFSTTEDAFEKFQSSAVTAIEDSDEYITLADIVPPQPSIPNLDDELNEIPFDNEVILSSNNEDNNSQHSNYSQSEHGNEILDISIGNASSLNFTRRRGGTSHSKKIPGEVEILNSNGTQRNVDVIYKTAYSEGLDMNEYQIGGQDFGYDDNQELIQDSVLSTTVGKHESRHDDIQQVDKKPNTRRTKRARIPNTSKYPLLSQDNFSKVITGKKRGRPRKATNDSQAEPDSTNVENSTSDNNFNDTSNSNSECSSKRRMLKKSKLPQESIDTSYTPAIHSKEVNNSSQVNKKRGRPSKKKKGTSLNLCSELDEIKDNLADNQNIIIENDGCNKKLKHNKEAAISKKEGINDNAADEDDGDNMSLSKLKQMSTTETNDKINEDVSNGQIEIDNNLSADFIKTSSTSNAKVIGGDCSVDGTAKKADSLLETDADTQDSQKESLLVEDPTKRRRRATTKQFHYEEESDEDPFANMESSEDEAPKRKKKSTRYNSDDEYIPCGEKTRVDQNSSNSDSDINDLEDGDKKKIKRKKTWRRSETSTPRKKNRKSESQEVPDDIWTKEDLSQKSDMSQDVEVSIEPVIIKRPAEAWATSNEFENFIAKKIQGTNTKIKKISSKKKTESSVTPIDIPFIDPTEAKKGITKCTQTDNPKTYSTSVQTSVPFDIPMKTNKDLTSEQSEKACEFLKSVVQTTAELGQLMTQKSEDFMQKKINTSNVTDTFKMDYCVRKSFLLFKLAKHNLVQMEEDLAKQYDEFLKTHGLSLCREEVKEIPTKKTENDSDCEIVDEMPAKTKTQKVENTKPATNPKRVFLNKELSIKITKKPSAEKEKKIDIKSRHAVWINDSVMVKKVKPTQSFLAQDSRNKKPPDQYVTEKMVKDFFEEYYRQKVIAVCAPFVSPEWTINRRTYTCHYFLKYDGLNCNGTCSTTMDTVSSNATVNGFSDIREQKLLNPKSLLSLCTDVIHQHLKFKTCDREMQKTASLHNDFTKRNGTVEPCSLFQICFRSLTNFMPRLASDKTSELDDELLSKQLVEQINESFEEDIIQDCEDTFSNSCEVTVISDTPMPLKTLCYRRIADLFKYKINDLSYLSDDELSLDIYPDDNEVVEIQSLFSLCVEKIQHVQKLNRCVLSFDMYQDNNEVAEIKSLFSLCIEKIQNLQKPNRCVTEQEQLLPSPESLKNITYKIVKILLYPNQLEHCNDVFTIQSPQVDNFMINCVNTLSDEAFQKLELPDPPDSYSDEDHDYEGDTEIDTNAEWLSQLQVQELRSCYTPTNDLVEDNIQSEADESVIAQCVPAIVKIEPIDDYNEDVVDLAKVKTEPCHGLNEMTVIPENVIMKTEVMDSPDETPNLNRLCYDVETFESYVRANKMISHSMSGCEEIFSQSALRVCRKHEPDFEEDNDPNMSLLIPHTYEPLHVENAKEGLMESSSDENSDARRGPGKKKTDKRKKQPRKPIKNSKSKDLPATTKEKPSTCEIPPTSKEKPTLNNDLAVLTRRMREKIRQEEKKVQSSDSDLDNEPLNIRKEKKNKSKDKNDEIQCNNVDSTEKVTENTLMDDEDEDEYFAGFSTLEQDEVKTFQNNMKKAFERLVPEELNPALESSEKADSISTFLMDSNEPVELLECEPSMPIFDDEPDRSIKRLNRKLTKHKNKVEKPLYKERNGWHCYNIDINDKKLYQDAKIFLEKLPEAFVETYLEYQELTEKDREDEEVDRLINLQSLNRGGLKDRKSKVRSKTNIEHKTSRSPSPGSDHYAELTPSEDEGANVEDEAPPSLPLRSSENILAKNLLMDDQDSDSDGGTKKIKSEINTEKGTGKSKTSPNCKLDSTTEKELMLTADKMMNKELTLLHTPVVMSEEIKLETEEGKEKGDLSKEGKTRQRPARNSSGRDYKNDDDSSSEEEKQWVSTKEKLLKRMGKKDDTSVDDAKRAKLVTEFIERRNDGRRRRQGGRRLSKKKMLERQKQLRVLSKELFGESSIDATPSGARGATQLFKGRRNIRAVIDKKSLARSTVLANMEEFERKRRLTIRQNRLNELLGCEDGVNVLVINNEVCLEYDFEEHQPIVSVHRFFTDVMKAHQYEGVKFMWDACFESIANVEAGHPGGGCILAHCMGLGKTLQVLALLHTVLTHPRVGMHRVLVCCPLSTVLNWVDEIHKWLGPVTDKIKVFELSKLRKIYERAYQLEDWYNGGGIFIIGYELFRSLTTLDPLIDDIRPSILKKIRTALLDPGPDIIVCDEGHLLKNDSSVLAVAMSRVVTKRRIVLTGTPMQNNLREYYCMVNFIKPNLLGTYSEYSNRFENPIMNGQHRDSREEDIKLMKARTHILHKVLEGCLQRQEASVLYPYLPKKHEYTVFISLTKCQWDLYKHYLLNYTNYTVNNKPNVLKDFHILQKIWSHPQVLHNFQTKRRDKVKTEKIEDDLALEDKEDIKPPETETWWLQYLDGGAMLDQLESSNKFVAVFKILHECVKLGDKVLIFSTSLNCLDALEYFLKRINDWNLGKDYYRLDGSVPAEVRQKWCREFNAEHNHMTKLFLISTRAGCLGLNMTAANRVIILDTSWNPAHDIQSIFRVYRFGQKKDCFIYRLVAMGTMEQKIYERSVTKQAVACRVVDEQQIDRHYNMADLNELYKYDESGSGVAGGVAVGVCDVALLRVARDSALHAVHEHDSLLRGGAEPALPEHEREHAWRQFQQEHANKQMQNDLDQQNQDEADRLTAEAAKLAAEPPAVVPPPPPAAPTSPAPAPPPPEKARRGRPPSARAPPRPTEDVRRGRASPPLDDEMVQQITNILIQHDVTKFMSEPSEIKSLVSRVRRLVSGDGSGTADADDLTASIANVMLRDTRIAASSLPGPLPPPPPLTDVRPSSPPPRRAYGRRSRPSPPSADDPSTSSAGPPPPAPPVDRHLPSNRTTRKRRAALAAETRFDPSTVIDLDDDDEEDVEESTGRDDEWRAPSDDDDVHGEPRRAPAPDPSAKPTGEIERSGKSSRAVPRTTRRDYTKTPPKSTEPGSRRPASPSKAPSSFREPEPNDSILLSDDEAPIAVPEVSPAPAPVATPPAAPADVEEEVPLHPSLLGNQNFVKIVAHTYLAGNPMLDEDAAVLAAQYSILKTIKEAESTGRPIVAGPVYDIAVKVLGKSVIKKVFEANPKTKDLCAENSLASTLQSVLGGGSKTSQSAPSPADTGEGPKTMAIKRPKIGPKSKVQKQQETRPKVEATAPRPPPVQLQTNLMPFKIVNNTIQLSTIDTENSAEECILPDDEPRHRTPQTSTYQPMHSKFQMFTDLRTKVVTESTPTKYAPVEKTTQKTSVPISGVNYTICLDSDEEEGAPASASGSGPVPVALTGPNSQKLPLPYLAQSAQPISAAPLHSKLTPVTFCAGQAVPISTAGIQQYRLTTSGLKPFSGPSVPISFTTAAGTNSQATVRQPAPTSLASGTSQSIIYLEPQKSTSSPQLVPVTVKGITSQVNSTKPPIVINATRSDVSNMLTLQLDASGPSSPAPVSSPASNIILMPRSQNKLIRLSKQPAASVAGTSAPINIAPKTSNNLLKSSEVKPTTVCKSGDIFRISESGQIEVLHTKSEERPKVVSQATVEKGSTDKTSKNVSQQKANPPKILNGSVDKLVSHEVEKAIPRSKASHTRTVSSSSDSSRSSSPDPLDILKNVVVIKASPGPNVTNSAPISTKESSVTKIKEPPSTAKSAPQKIKITTKPSPSNTKPGSSKLISTKISTTNTTTSTSKTISTATTSTRNTSNSTKSSATATTSARNTSNTSKSSANSNTTPTNKQANKMSESKANSKNTSITSIDLTNIGTTMEIKQSKLAENRKLITITAPSTSNNTRKNNKNAVENKKGLIKTVDLTSFGASNINTSKYHVTKEPAISIKPKIEKRSGPPSDNSATKKKKTELMTLKDFDIDDIDDIIELD